MENQEKIMNEMEEKVEVEETGMAVVQGFDGIAKRSTTKSSIFTNITDKKKIFNLETKVDYLLNDCENELIRVKEVLIKRYEKPMKTPEVDEETGEITKDKEITMACILIDDNNKSYATGSKIFTINMMKYLQMFREIPEEGIEIRIVKIKQDSGNKALGFELV